MREFTTSINYQLRKGGEYTKENQLNRLTMIAEKKYLMSSATGHQADLREGFVTTDDYDINRCTASG